MSQRLAPEAVPRLPRGVRLHHDPRREEWMLLGPERVMKPDSIALEILKCCDGTATVAAIVTELADRFGAPMEQVDKDVRVFLTELADKRMMELA